MGVGWLRWSRYKGGKGKVGARIPDGGTLLRKGRGKYYQNIHQHIHVCCKSILQNTQNIMSIFFFNNIHGVTKLMEDL